jgi:hypothetical protein
MTPSQNKRLQVLLTSVQNIRRALDKEAANGMTGIGVSFGTEIDINDAIWGIVYVEKALARIWERESFVRTLTPGQKDKLRMKPFKGRTPDA